MLKTKRKSQQDAVKRILDLNDSKKEKDMVKIVLKKLFETLISSLQKLAQTQTSSGSKNGIKLDQNTMSGIKVKSRTQT